MERKTVFGTDSSRLAQLLQLGRSSEDTADPVSPDEARAECLREFLAVKLPAEEWQEDDSHGSGDCLHQTIDAVMWARLGAYLRDSDCPVAALKGVKAYGAKRSRDSTEDVQREVATTIYYAAIAAALVNCDEKITAFSRVELRVSFTSLAERPWLTKGLRSLFQEAAQRCQKGTVKEES